MDTMDYSEQVLLSIESLDIKYQTMQAAYILKKDNTGTPFHNIKFVIFLNIVTTGNI